MKSDPIVDEVRAIRDRLAARCGYDIDEIFRRIRRRQVESGRKYVRYPARRVTTGNDTRTSGTKRRVR